MFYDETYNLIALLGNCNIQPSFLSLQQIFAKHGAFLHILFWKTWLITFFVSPNFIIFNKKHFEIV